MKHDITTRTISTLNAEGKHNSKHCRPVIIIEEGKTFTSIMDAAEYLGVNYSALWAHLDGRYKTCKRKHVRYADEYEGTVDELSAEVRKGNQENDALKAENAELKTELAEWREFKKQKEAERKAEEKRLEEERKAEEARNKKIAKLDVEIGNLGVMIQREEDKLASLYATKAEKERQKAKLQGNTNATNNEEEMWTA